MDKQMLKPLFVSFSGGKTSAYMAIKLARKFRGKRLLVFVFANTGQEREETLEFVDAIDKAYRLNVVWIEADVNPEKGIGTGFRIVSFETASRYGEPYAAVIAKYGLPNMTYQHCTRELKLVPIKAYVRSLGFKHREYEMAIGIRADEADRISGEGEKHCAVYPLHEEGIDKTDVNMFFDSHTIKLNLEPHEGNCTWCFKKSDKKHAMLYASDPTIYEFPARMEADYTGEDQRRIFRGKRNTAQHIEYIKTIDITNYRERPDERSGCSESCEAFA